MVCSVCCDCQYIGDKYSFPRPNNLIDMDEDNPYIKHFYCCMGDCEQYKKDVSVQFIKECECFESIDGKEI